MGQFDKNEFGRRLKLARKGARLSQESLGDSIGVSGAAVAQWESGSTLPTADRLAAACAKLRVTSDALLQLTDLPTPKPSLMAAAADLPEPLQEALLQIVSQLSAKTPSERRFYRKLEKDKPK